jgi:hypothetical protein
MLAMSESLLSTLLRWGTLSAVVVLASAICIRGIVLFLTYTRVAALLFICVIISFVGPNSFGYLRPPEFSVYTKGGGLLFFPLFQLYLYGLFLATLFQNTLAGRDVMKGAGGRWTLAFAALFACQVAYGLATGVPLDLVMSTGGLINVLHMSMIAYVAVSALRDEYSLGLAVRTFLGIAVLRGCYGLARFLFAGGDPQNAYRDGSLKLTFFDSSEGLIASLVVSYCAGQLIRSWSTLSAVRRAFFAGAIGVELLVILLSYRRTSWYGFLLGAFYFVWLLPRNKRAITAALVVLPMILAVISLNAARNPSPDRSDPSAVDRIAPDVDAHSGITSPSSRFYELYRAFQTVEQHPLLGVGAWGQFQVSANDLQWHQGNFGFVHSGLGHILLKSGLVGLVLFCGTLISAWRFAAQGRAHVAERHLALFDSFMAGLVFMVPTLLFGGPIVDIRSMALLGVLLAVPVAIVRVARFQQTEAASTPEPMIPRANASTPQTRTLHVRQPAMRPEV